MFDSNTFVDNITVTERVKARTVVTSAPSLTVFKRQQKIFLFDFFFMTTYLNYVPCHRSYFAYVTLIFTF